MSELPQVPSLRENPLPPVQPYDIAVLIDNTVYQLMNVDGIQAAMFLAQPKFVQVAFGQARIGQKYNPETKEFYSEEE